MFAAIKRLLFKPKPLPNKPIVVERFPNNSSLGGHNIHPSTMPIKPQPGRDPRPLYQSPQPPRRTTSYSAAPTGRPHRSITEEYNIPNTTTNDAITAFAIGMVAGSMSSQNQSSTYCAPTPSNSGSSDFGSSDSGSSSCGSSGSE